MKLCIGLGIFFFGCYLLSPILFWVLLGLFIFTAILTIMEIIWS